MKHIIFTIVIFALFIVSCNSENQAKTDENTANDSIASTEENIDTETAPLVSKIELLDNEGEGNSVTLKYDNENRLVEMIPDKADVSTKISYDKDKITVIADYITETYEFAGNTITDTYEIDGEIITKTVFKLNNGQVQESTMELTDAGSEHITYKWDSNCLKEKIATGDDNGDKNESTTKYTYSNVRNLFGIDVLAIIKIFALNLPEIGSIADGFQSEFLPDEITWDGLENGYIPTKYIYKYEYVFDKESITEIHISCTSITSEDDGEEYTQNSKQTIKLSY